MKEIYEEAFSLGIPVIGHQHGNQDIKNVKPNLREKGRVSWDYITVFGQKERDSYEPHIDLNLVLSGGIPCNDKLKEYQKTDKNILVIVNFLGNRGAPFLRFDKRVFDKLCLLDLQKEYNILLKKGPYEYDTSDSSDSECIATVLIFSSRQVLRILNAISPLFAIKIF